MYILALNQAGAYCSHEVISSGRRVAVVSRALGADLPGNPRVVNQSKWHCMCVIVGFSTPKLWEDQNQAEYSRLRDFRSIIYKR